MEEYSHLLQGDAKKEYKQAKHQGLSFASNSVLSSKDLEMMVREMERLKRSEKEA